MFAKNYWSHDSPGGKTPWDFISASGYVYATAGENLAKDFDTSYGVVNGWMGSTGHRTNILNSSFKDTGIAVVNGVLQGSETTLVVALYAAPKAVSTPAPTTAIPKTTAPKPATTVPQPTATEIPAPTPVQTETSTSDPSPAPEIQPAKKITIQATPATKVNNEKSLDQTLHVKEQRTWAQNASLFILSTLLLITLLKHTVVWRTQKRGLRHIWLRAHPAAQSLLLLAAILANIYSGIGVIL
jgi:hypothetical protein